MGDSRILSLSTSESQAKFGPDEPNLLSNFSASAHPVSPPRRPSRIFVAAKPSRHSLQRLNSDSHFSTIAAAKEPWRTLFSILAMTGLRAGEALGLQWGDIDFERRMIYVRRSAWYGRIQTPKSKNSEAVLPMPEPLAAVLKGYQEQWKPNPSGFLFVTRNGRPPSSNKVVECRLWPILNQLKIPRCGLHAFRHTVASLLVDTGAAVTVAQAQLRHSDAKTTLGYTHLLGDSHRRAMEKVASVLDLNGLKSRPVSPLIQ